MIPLSDQEQYMKSMVDHPAGRHRRPPTPVDCLGPNRPAAPGDSPAFEAIGLALAIIAVLAVTAIVARIGHHVAGVPGAIAGAAATMILIGLWIRGESR